VINYICAVIKPRLGSDKTGFYTVQSKETDILFFFNNVINDKEYMYIAIG